MQMNNVNKKKLKLKKLPISRDILEGVTTIASKKMGQLKDLRELTTP